ncbi:efflux RND transporter periplasmic adaptor subunit [Massilia sp. MB5]|nr:HlyD family efflux transporter periplasmic adaptor subunit [Massilia sp. MB5]UMR29536.1 efflux RND transporter periplasmic adaptor subunit [Massilia sp. MB5]
MGAVAKIDFDNSQITQEQNRNLLDIARQREESFGANTVAQLRAAEAQRDQAASALAVAQQEADALSVRAGINGILQQLSVEPGQQVAAGASLARVARPAPLMARLQVPEIQAKDLRQGLPVLVDTHNGEAEGTLTRIDPAVRNGSVLVDVNFAGELPASARPDLSVDGRIVLDKLRNVVSIARPMTASARASGTLFVLNADGGTARRQHVVYGAASSDRVEVVQGIAPGERVILTDLSRWNAYQALRLN